MFTEEVEIMKSLTNTSTLKGSAGKLFIFALLVAVFMTAFMPIAGSVVYGETSEEAISVKTWTVKFIDIDGTVLKTQIVEDGGDATPPAIKSKKGYKFLGWNAYYTNVTSDVTVSAVYELVMTTTKEDKGKLAAPDTANPPPEEKTPEKLAVATEGGMDVVDTSGDAITTPEIIKNNPTPTTVIEEETTGIATLPLVLIIIASVIVIAAVVFFLIMFLKKRRKQDYTS